MVYMANFLEQICDKMKLIFSLITSILILCYSCKQEEIISTNGGYNTNNQEEPELLWKFPLSPDTTERWSITPILFNEYIVFTGKIPLAPLPNTVKCIDSIYLTYLWEADDVFLEDCADMSYTGGSGYGVYQNYMATLCYDKPRVVDLNSGNVIWDYNPGNGDINMSVWNDKFIHTRVVGDNPFTKSAITMSGFDTPDFDTLYYVDSVDGFSCHLYPPAFMIDDNNDTLIVFQNRQWKSPPYQGKVDLYGYNISDDTLLWKIESIDDYGSSSVFPPLIDNGNVYFKSDYSVHCINVKTGNENWVWESITGSDLLLANLLIADGKLIVKTGGNELYALSLSSGAVIWENTSAGLTPEPLTMFEDVIYYVTADGKLHAVALEDGKELWSFESPNNGQAPSYITYFYNGISIDPVTKRMYVTDIHYLNCFQLK